MKVHRSVCQNKQVRYSVENKECRTCVLKRQRSCSITWASHSSGDALETDMAKEERGGLWISVWFSRGKDILGQSDHSEQRRTDVKEDGKFGESLLVHCHRQ